MSTIHLEEPLTAGGLQATNFFNGRLLSGEDLTHEQAMNLLGHRRLGQAIGVGVAFGLEVRKSASQSTASNPVLSVKRGLAVNAKGQTLWLQDDTSLAIVRAAAAPTVTGEVFGLCDQSPPGVSVSGDGAYLLTIAPSAKKEGKAPVSGLGNLPAACNSRYTTLGVQFRLFQLPVDAELADANRARNRIAYRCFGTNADEAFFRNPFSLPAWRPGLPVDVRPIGLTDCDVPLAVVGWRATDIQFVDQWAVRRRITRPAADRDWPLLLSDQRLSEREAMFSQFQDHIGDLLSETNTTSIVASDRLAFLPPVGFLPIASGGSIRGFVFQTFFQNKVHRDPVFIEGARVVSLMHEALDYPPIDLTTGEMVWLYWVRENMQAIDNGLLNPPQAHLIFVNGYLPSRGDARYDVNRWNYSNYARP
jgi:hypothetical protein